MILTKKDKLVRDDDPRVDALYNHIRFQAEEDARQIPTGMGAIKLIAGYNAPARVKARADRICNNKNDDVEIQWAFNSLTSGRNWIETVKLIGSFTLAAQIDMGDYTRLDITDARLTLADNVNDNMIMNSDVGGGNSYLEIIGGILDGNTTNNTMANGGLIWFSNVAHAEVSHVYVFESAKIGVAYTNVDYGSIHDCYADGCDAAGFDYDQAGVSYCSMYNLFTNGCAYGLTIDSSDYLNVSDLILKDSTNVGFIIGNASRASDYCNVNNVFVSGSGSYGVEFNNFNYGNATNIIALGNTGQGVRIINCNESNFDNILSNSNDTNGIGLLKSDDINLSNFTVKENEQHGISIWGNCTHVTITDGKIIDNSNDGAGNYHGINASGDGTDGYATYINIHDCEIYDDQGVPTQGYGVRSTGSCDYFSVKNTRFSGNATGTYTLSGSNNIVHGNPGASGTSGDIYTISESIDHASIVDGGGLTGTYDLTETIPTGCEFVSAEITISQAFKDTVGANTFVKIMLGTAADDDRFYKTATPGDDIWNSTTTLNWGQGEIQGTAKTTAATTLRMTFTVDADMTDLISGAGAQGTMNVKVTYRKL